MRIPGPKDLFELPDRVVGGAESLVALAGRAAALLTEAEALIHRANALLDTLEPPLTALAPVLDTVARTTSPQETQALVSAIDMMPELVAGLRKDVLPVLVTMETVSPDLRELLITARELNEMLTHLPGMGRARRRAEQQVEAELEHFSQ